MNHNKNDNIQKLRQGISQEAYEASSTDGILAKVMGPKPSCPPTSVALLKSNLDNIKEAAELGMTKTQAAMVIACDPRNTGKPVRLWPSDLAPKAQPAEANACGSWALVGDLQNPNGSGRTRAIAILGDARDGNANA